MWEGGREPGGLARDVGCAVEGRVQELGDKQLSCSQPSFHLVCTSDEDGLFSSSCRGWRWKVAAGLAQAPREHHLGTKGGNLGQGRCWQLAWGLATDMPIAKILFLFISKHTSLSG